MKTREIARHIAIPVFILDIQDRYEAEQGALRARVRPQGKLRFELIERMQDSEPRPITPLRLVMTRNFTGYWIFMGDVILADGTRRNWRYMLPGIYVLRVSDPADVFAPFTQAVLIQEPTSGDQVPVYKIALGPDLNYPGQLNP